MVVGTLSTVDIDEAVFVLTVVVAVMSLVGDAVVLITVARVVVDLVVFIDSVVNAIAVRVVSLVVVGGTLVDTVLALLGTVVSAVVVGDCVVDGVVVTVVPLVGPMLDLSLIQWFQGL